MIRSIAILAGGKGTRIAPLTQEIPKYLVPINRRPFVDWQMELLVNSGIRKVVLCLGHRSNQIIDYVGNGEKYGLEVVYSVERTTQGTAGALANALGLLSDPFGVLYGDSYLPIDFLSIGSSFLVDKYDALMTVFKNSNIGERSNIEFANNEVTYYSKKASNISMHYIDFGFSVVKKGIFNLIESERPSDLSSIFGDLARRNLVQGVEMFKQYFEIGSFQGIKNLEKFLKGV